MQQGGEIIPVPIQLPDLSSNQIKYMINFEQSLRSSSSPQTIKDNGFYHENMGIVRIKEQLHEPSSDAVDMTDEEGDQREAEDVVDGDDDTRSREENGDLLYSSAIIQQKALYVLDPQSTAIAMQDFDPKNKTLEDSKAVLITKVVKFYKKQPVDLYACSCDALRSRNVFNSSMDLFCCLKDFNNLYPLCLHIRALERIKSVTSVKDLQQKSPENCRFCSYENDKEVFCLTKLLFGKQLYAISSTECTYGIVEVVCGSFNCLICKGAECQHVKCLQSTVKSMDIDAQGVPDVLKEVYLNLFSVKPEDSRASTDNTETIYYHLSNGQTTVVGNSQSLEGLKLPPEKKRKKRVPQTDARRFHCDNCHKSFKHKHHLREHMHLHTGEQPFECKTCGRKFSHSGSLSQHRQRSCSSGTPCQTRQRNSNAKAGSSRKSSSPRSNTNVTDHKTDEEMTNSPQENAVSPPATKSKKAGSPRSNLLDQKSSMEFIDMRTDNFSSPVKPVGKFVTSEALTVSPESALYKSVLKSHDIPVALKQPERSANGLKYMALDSSLTETTDVKPSVKIEANALIQHPSDFLSKIVCDQPAVVKTEKGINQHEEHVCSVCRKTFSGAQGLRVHMRMHTTSEMPFWCNVCGQGFHQNNQLQCHLGSEEHQRKQAQMLLESSTVVSVGTAVPSVVSSAPPLLTDTSVQSENAEPTVLSFSKPVLSQMINTPSWDMFTSKSATSLPSISELMSSVTTHLSRKKETMSLAQTGVISDKMLMSASPDSAYSSGLQLMSSAPDEVIQQSTPKIHLYDPNSPSLSNDKLSMMQQMELSQNQAKLSLVSSENLTNASSSSPTSPVSSNIQQSSTQIQSQQPYLPQSSFSQHSPGQAAPPTSYGTYPAISQVTSTEQDSALKALCSFTEKPIPSDAAESLAGVTGTDNSILTEQKISSSEASPDTPVVYNYAQSWNGWNNWNGAYPVYGVPGQPQNWNGTFAVPVASSWQGYPEPSTNGGVPTNTSVASQMNSGIPASAEQKTKVIPQPKPPAKPKAPYSRYSIKVWNSVKSSNPNLSVGEMNRLIGQMWRGLPEDEKNQFLEDYSAEKEKYKVEYEKFRSSPEFQIWLASNIDKNSNSKKRPYDTEAEQLEDRQDYRQFIVKAT